MAYPTGLLSTLIVKVGKNDIWAGYAGDFHPMHLEMPASPTAHEEETLDLEKSLMLIAKLLKQKQTDSLLMITPNSTSCKEKQRMAAELSDQSVCRSVLFLPKAVCEAFGNGKTSSVVISCGFVATEVSLVTKGELTETRVLGKGLQPIYDRIRDILERNNFSRDAPVEAITQIIVEKALTFRDCSEYFRDKDDEAELKGMVKEYIKECVSAVETATAMVRGAHHKKSFGQNCVVIAGRVCSMQMSIGAIVEEIKNELGENVKDMLVYNTLLPAAFTGASVFGLNNQSKTMFTSPKDVRYDVLSESPQRKLK